MDKIQQLADYIDQSHSMVAITGAGISLAGGGITYSQLAHTVHPGDFESDDFLRSYVKAMHSYKPSFSHYALRDLEAAGKLTGIITTNEDCMHTMAGSENVAEIQGGFQINPGHTGFDRIANLNIREESDDVFHKLIEHWNGND